MAWQEFDIGLDEQGRAHSSNGEQWLLIENPQAQMHFWGLGQLHALFDDGSQCALEGIDEVNECLSDPDARFVIANNVASEPETQDYLARVVLDSACDESGCLVCDDGYRWFVLTDEVALKAAFDKGCLYAVQENGCEALLYTHTEIPYYLDSGASLVVQRGFPDNPCADRVPKLGMSL